jgi:hypothetical protein
LPQVADEINQKPEHALHLQEQMLLEWLTAHAEKTDDKTTENEQAQSIAAASEKILLSTKV